MGYKRYGTEGRCEVTKDEMTAEIEKRVSKLRPREREVLRLIVLGRDSPSIGRTLCISPHTAKFHVSNIMATLGVQSREAAYPAQGLLGGGPVRTAHGRGEVRR